MNRFFVSCLLLAAFTESASAKEKPMKQIRTLMTYSYPVDPVKIVSIADMDLSYALTSTLVAWDKDKQVAAALASSWERVSPTLTRFKIRNGLKWSDGNTVIAPQVKQSFEAAFKAHPSDLRSLINIVKSINVMDTETIEFHTHEGADTELLSKLTEPNYGILKIGPSGRPDTSVTTGAFYLSNATENELTLTKNPNWYLANNDMPNEVVIKRPDAAVDMSQALLNDSWPNLVEVSSLVPKEMMDRYRSEGFQVWTRPLDKVLLIQLSNRSAKKNGPALLRYLSAKLDREQLTKGLSGFSLATQVFPKGYQLHDDTPVQKQTNVAMPEAFLKRPLQVLVSKSRVSPTLQGNLESALKSAGLKYELRFTALDKISENKKKGEYDIYVGTMGLADPDPEGVMSYYFEGDTPVVQPGNESFLKSLDSARKIKDSLARIKALRAVMTEATAKGHILPLFHLSTVAIGCADLDFSSVPKSDESVTLSKIRFKKGQ